MEMLIVDEVDRMLEKGHFEELGQIVNWIHRCVPFLVPFGVI
jgi:superfamily II DNA/RNA helicase